MFLVPVRGGSGFRDPFALTIEVVRRSDAMVVGVQGEVDKNFRTLDAALAFLHRRREEPK